MKIRHITFLMGLSFQAAIANVPRDTVTEDAVTKVKRVSLLKNGLAYVTQNIQINGAGNYLLPKIPIPVYGTAWVDSEHVKLRSTTHEVAISNHLGNEIFQTSLEGKEVTLHLQDKIGTVIRGVVKKVTLPDKEVTWKRDFNSLSNGVLNNAYNHVQSQYYLVIEREDGMIEYVRSSLISRLSVREIVDEVMVEKPVFIAEVGDSDLKEFSLSYLAKGLTWSPSYRLSLLDDNEMIVEQKALIKNELMDLDDVEVSLISGYPNIRFSEVDSLLSPWQSIASYLSQLSGVNRNFATSLSNVASQAISYGQSNVGNAQQNEKEGPDIHYQKIGEATMAIGDSLMVSVDKNKVKYEEIVEWLVPDLREYDGRISRRNQTNGTAWDALRFKNPLPFPMTTAAAMIHQGDKLLGEGQIKWVNEGESTVLHITKALSVKTEQSECELPDSRESIKIAGRNYRKATVKGSLKIMNFRNEIVKLHIKRQFSGELIEASDSPYVQLREEGVWSVNKRNELCWELNLEPNAEREVTYTYEVLAYH